MRSTWLSLTLLSLTLTATAALAGQQCHISNAAPIVTDWTITGKVGGFTIDARLAPRAPGISLAATYNVLLDADHLSTWWHDFTLRPVGSSGNYAQVDMSGATVTDSTFHIEVAYPTGVYDYAAFIGGRNDGEQEYCYAVYEFHGTVAVVDVTPVRRASWGAVKAIWR